MCFLSEGAVWSKEKGPLRAISPASPPERTPPPRVPGAEPAQQPDVTGAVQEEAVREQELKMMALRLDTAYEQLEAKKRAHDAAMQQVPLCG